MNALLLLAAACLQPSGPLVPFDYNKTGVAQGCAEGLQGSELIDIVALT